MNVTDLLLKSEEDSRKNRDRGDGVNTFNSDQDSTRKNEGRDSLVEFGSDSPSQNLSKNNKKNSRKKNSKKICKNSDTAPKTSISFYIDDHEISHSSLIFEALYKYEQEKANNYDLIPNVWNQTYTVTYKKNPSRKRISSSLNSSLSSEGNNSPDINLPFCSYNNSSLTSEQDTIIILRMLGILNEFNSKQMEIFAWIYDAPFDMGHIYHAPSRLFVNSKIAAKMNRQLDEPLIVASRVLPRWCNTICYEFPFLLPFDTRLTYLQSQSFGYSRNMARWQQMASSTPTSPNGFTSILGRIQRQKIRISRKKILESMIKAMDSYGSTQALLEIEFFDEVGTGLGPTLEFYSQVCLEIRRRSGILLSPSTAHCVLWRNDLSYQKEPSTEVVDDYLNVLFPRPYGSKEKKKY